MQLFSCRTDKLIMFDLQSLGGLRSLSCPSLLTISHIPCDEDMLGTHWVCMEESESWSPKTWL